MVIAIVLAALTVSSVAAGGRASTSDAASEPSLTASESAAATAPGTVATLHQGPAQRRATGDSDPNTYVLAQGVAAGSSAGTAGFSDGSSGGDNDVQGGDSADNGDDGSRDRIKINWHRKYCDKTRDELLDNAVAAEEALEGLCDPGSLDELPGLPDGVEVVAATPCRGWANIFNADGTTVYFFYVDVLLSQDGITSARTLETPMTLEADGWTPSDIGIQTDGLAFVQSVEF
jgi:hypothetical protein